jgi:heptosyltransferase-2
VIDEYLRLAEYLGAANPQATTELAICDEDRAALDGFWTRQTPGLRLRGVVCLNTGGAFGPAKNWPRESFAELARRIVDELQRTVVVVCGPAEREEARVIVREAGRSEVLSLAGEPLSIGLTKAAVRESRLLITTDSGPRHFAQPFGVPVITLFGPTHIAWSETHYDQAVHLNVPVPCGPCQQRECPLGHHRCMTELTVDRVFGAAKRVLTPRSLPLRVA